MIFKPFLNQKMNNIKLIQAKYKNHLRICLKKTENVV